MFREIMRDRAIAEIFLLYPFASHSESLYLPSDFKIPHHARPNDGSGL